MASKRQAVWLAGGIGVLLAAPVLFLRWLDAAVDPQDRDLGGVAEFLATDAAGQSMSRFDLDGNLTIVAWLGGVCRPLADPRCVRAVHQLEGLTAWSKKRLIFSDETEQSPVKLVAVAPAGVALPDGWRRLDVAADGDSEGRALLPASCSESDAPLVLIDQSVRARRCFALAGAEDWSAVRPLLSKMTINHYMRDYLAKRTFFRRTPKDPKEAPEGSTH